MDGLPLGHPSLALPGEYNYHHAMAQHAAVVSATNNTSLHPSAIAQIPMLPTGLNLSMNAGKQSITSRMPSGLASGTHHLSHASSLIGGTSSHKSKNKKPKVNKDGVPAPKRATTAYINFTQWYRGDQKKTGRQIPKIGEFGKECANKWNNMTSEEKQPFLEIAAQDRERYKKEMAIYKPARDVNKPKRPGTAFMLFMADLRKEMAGKEPEGGVAALAKLGGERWRGMTDEEKRKYIEKQGEEKLRYEQNMEDYRKKQSAVVSMPPAAKQPRLEENTEESSDSLETSSASAPAQIPQLTQQSNSNSSSLSSPLPHSNVPSPNSGTGSPSPPPPTLSPGPTVSTSNVDEAGPSSMAALSSLTSPMSLTHAMAMGYAQHTLSNFASGMLVPNFNQAHAHNSISSSPYIPAATYNQPHLPGPYSWN